MAEGQVLSAAPKLRTDLIISRQETREGTFFVFKDPLTSRFFRFREAEHFIARQLDGAAPVESIRQNVEERFGSPLALETLQGFIETLRRLGLLEPEIHEARRVARTERGSIAKQGAIRGSLLYLRTKAFDPHLLLSRLKGKLRIFFTPYFVVCSALVIVSGLAVTAVNWSDITRDFRSLWRFDALLLAWSTVLLVTAAHEFAHGLTCARFGGQVHEMGFMLIYFQPAFYCNVSDAWLFPEKSHRLWVTFAGAYFEIFLWALATLIWRIVEPHNWLSFFALVVMATSGVKTIFNLNPLIKLDGYYLLSDYLEIPNLRQKALEYWGSLLRRLRGSTLQGMEEATRRERRIYLVYGLLAVVYSYWLLGWVTLYFGQYLVGRYQAFGFIVFSGLVIVTFQGSLVRAVSRASAAFGSMSPKWPEMQKRLKETPKRLKWIVALAVLGLALFGRFELRVAGEFNVRPRQNADVRAEVEGFVEKVFVEEGSVVKKGDLLTCLSERDYQADVGKVEAEIHEKQASLRMFQAGPTSVEIELARKELGTARTRHLHARQQYDEADRIHGTRLARAETAVKTAEDRLQYARNSLGRIEGLFPTGIISRQQLEESQEQVHVRERELQMAQAEWKMVSADHLAEMRKELDVALNGVAEAEGKLDVLRAGTRPEAIEAMEAEITRLELQRKYLKEQLQRLQVVSPASGVITTPKPKEMIGQHVKKGDLILKVLELENVRPEVAVSEHDIADVNVGQPVVLKARAYPERSFTGRVAAIAPAAELDPVLRKIVRVTIEMNEPEGPLKPEMTGNAKIFCGKRSLFSLLTRRIARYLRVEFWSWW
jgi:multidrug resistance efflux pump